MDKDKPSKSKSLDEQIKEAELKRIRSESAKFDAEKAEIEKRTNQKKLFGIPIYQTIVGGLAAGLFIVGFSWTFLMPVLNKDAQIASKQSKLQDIENRLERARLDSSNRILAVQKAELERQVQLITARLDSSNQRRQAELAAARKALASEKAKSQSNQSRVQELTAQVSTLQQDITQAEAEKQEIRRIAKSPYLSAEAVAAMLKEKNYFCREGVPWSNSSGAGLDNKFKFIGDGEVVRDGATGCIWQRHGSTGALVLANALAYVDSMNQVTYAGLSNWRLPTLEEAMSLVEPRKNGKGLHINASFDQTQKWIWTSDEASAGTPWIVSFFHGRCYRDEASGGNFVRAVGGRKVMNVVYSPPKQ